MNRQPFAAAHQCWLTICAVLLALSIGCQTFKRARWEPPFELSRRVPLLDGALDCSQAEAAYEAAMELEQLDDTACVEAYFRSATLAWPEVARQSTHYGHVAGRVADVYRAAVTKLITAGQHFRRLDPRCGLRVSSPQGSFDVPIHHYGFLWQPNDFDCLIPVGDYRTRGINRFYKSNGIGVPAVTIHRRRADESFVRDETTFAATALLRPTAMGGFELQLYDPFRVTTVPLAGRRVGLERDLTAQLAYVMSNTDREYVTRFLRPGQGKTNSGLFMIEPYQPGKIPIVFMHGLLSDPLTWANLANEIRVRPDLLARYQIWAFEYDTGEPFLESAAMLRRQLRELHTQLDPAGVDPALARMVLVGHSMGGLVAKLQVTCSGSQLWQAAANRPFQTIPMAHDTRRILRDSFFFNPLPWITRLVFIGTPHRGSPWAQRPIGRLGSALVDEPVANETRHEQLICDNPQTFSEEFAKRIPTSIDLLRADSPLLQAIERLPVSGNVTMHSIIGSYRTMIGAGDSDGVVPTSSASITGVVSEKYVEARHVGLPQSEEGIVELVRILRLHAAELFPAAGVTSQAILPTVVIP